MTDFDKFFGAAYDLVDTIKSDGKSFVAVVYDKHAKRLCLMKERDARLTELYKILRELDLPHVPKIYRTFDRDGKLVVIEEHIDGQTLDEILTYRPEILSEKLATKILLQVCDALVELHKADIIHRDLTPSNIMLTADNAVKLVDFGIARIFKPESSADTEFLGTRGYAAPEQFGVFDLGQTDARTDIFVLGTTVKNLLGKDYRGKLVDVLNRCTDLNPANRYQSAGDVIRAVKRAQKLYLLKRVTLTVAMLGVISFAAKTIDFTDYKGQATSDTGQVELPTVAAVDIPTVAEVQPPEVAEVQSPATLSDDTAKSLIDFANTSTDAQIFTVPDVQVAPLPTRPPLKVEPVKEPEPKRSRLADRVKLYLYINGKLTENNGEYTTLGNVTFTAAEVESWPRNDKGDVLFPANFTARLTIDNITTKDLVDPLIGVRFGSDKDTFSDGRPTVAAGQKITVDIPIAGKLAFRAGQDEGTLTVAVRPSSEKRGVVLRRNLEIQ
ncbi:MAG: serine/threonine protein kinase [Selenomonadaceae bacterium]|nr:serine/threonine protein kinase [Selenomonadaceae bacterium]